MSKPQTVFRWREAIRDSRTLSTTDRLVALILSLRMNRRGECWPGIGLIRAETGFKSDRTVQQAIRRLEACGFLTVRQNAGPKGCNIYASALPGGASDDARECS